LLGWSNIIFEARRRKGNYDPESGNWETSGTIQDYRQGINGFERRREAMRIVRRAG